MYKYIICSTFIHIIYSINIIIYIYPIYIKGFIRSWVMWLWSPQIASQPASQWEVTSQWPVCKRVGGVSSSPRNQKVRDPRAPDVSVWVQRQGRTNIPPSSRSQAGEVPLPGRSVSFFVLFRRWAHPHKGEKCALFILLIQIWISSKTLMGTPRIMFDQISWHHMPGSDWHKINHEKKNRNHAHSRMTLILLFCQVNSVYRNVCLSWREISTKVYTVEETYIHMRWRQFAVCIRPVFPLHPEFTWMCEITPTLQINITDS